MRSPTRSLSYAPGAGSPSSWRLNTLTHRNLMSELRQLQSRFVKYIGMLITHAYGLPHVELTFGEGYDDDGTGHMAGSLHYIRIAQDINLFVGGNFIQGDHPVWHQLGTYWRSLDPMCAWGGDFASRDFNHFSMEYHNRR